MYMIRRAILVSALALSVSAWPAWADKGGVPNANASSNASNSNDTRSEKSSNAGQPPGHAKKALPETDPDAALVLPQVEARRAIDLSALRRAVAKVSSGRILDVTIADVAGQLVYDVTVEEADGVIRHVLLRADSGGTVGHRP